MLVEQGELAMSKDMLLRSVSNRESFPLELYVESRGGSEFHFYLRGLTVGELAQFYRRELEGLEVLLYTYDLDLLSPEFWEAHALEVEERLRRELGGVWVRSAGGGRQVWRGDRAKETRRILAEPGSDVSMVRGTVLKMSGVNFLSLVDRFERSRRLEWAAFQGIPAGSEEDSWVGRTMEEMARWCGLPSGAWMAVSSEGNHFTRVLLAQREACRRGVGGALRGYVQGLSGQHVSMPSGRCVDLLMRMADGLGIYAAPERDYQDKGRTFEIKAHVGRTAWGSRRPDALDKVEGDERLLIYYDRTSGIWEVVS
jgi:hypothetical protein